MPSNATVYAGTIGQSIWRSRDGGETWERLRDQLFAECDVRAIAVHPRSPHILYAGTEMGCYRTDDGGDHWMWLDSEMNRTPIWALAIHPHRPDTVFAGTCPSALYRTDNGGATWKKLGANIETDCPPIIHTRVTTIVVDPTDDRTIWAGVEIDGVYRSTDDGITWTAHKEGLNSLDIHGLAVIPGTPKTLIATTNQGICTSTDNGETWQDLHVKDRFPWGYCRGIARKADGSSTAFVGNGNGPPGDAGAIQRSDDHGQSWHQAALSIQPNSTIWNFATNPANPSLLFAYSISGQVFRSTNGGATWTKLRREFGEVRAMVWV